MNSTQLWWYAARSGGIVAWALVSASVVWGLLLSSKVLGKRPRPNWMLDLHRFLGGTAVTFTVVHVVSVIMDSYVHFGPAEVLVPFVGSWHPVAVAWGIVAMYAMAAVELTSLLRKRLSKRAWRLTHGLSFPLFGFSTIHALSAGTERSNPIFFGAAVAVSVLVAGLTAWRIKQVTGPRPPARTPIVRRPPVGLPPEPAPAPDRRTAPEPLTIGAPR